MLRGTKRRRDVLTDTIVGLTLFGTAPLNGIRPGAQLIAATGEGRRTLVRCLDPYADLRVGAGRAVFREEVVAGAARLIDLA